MKIKTKIISMYEWRTHVYQTKWFVCTRRMLNDTHTPREKPANNNFLLVLPIAIITVTMLCADDVVIISVCFVAFRAYSLIQLVWFRLYSIRIHAETFHRIIVWRLQMDQLNIVYHKWCCGISIDRHDANHAKYSMLSKWHVSWLITDESVSKAMRYPLDTIWRIPIWAKHQWPVSYAYRLVCWPNTHHKLVRPDFQLRDTFIDLCFTQNNGSHRTV